MTDAMQNFSFRKEVYALVDKSNFTHKIIFTVLIAFMLSIAYPFVSQTLGVNNGHTNTNIAHAESAEQKQWEEDTDKEGTDGNKSKYQRDKWTLYAGFIMDNDDASDDKKDDNEGEEEEGLLTRGIKGTMAGIIGDGGVTVDIPFNKFYAGGWNAINGPDTGKPMERDERSQDGRYLASFLSTYNYYGYIDTVSGNSLAAESNNIVSSIGKGIGAFFAGIALTIYYMMSSFITWIVEFLVAMNPYRLLGFDKGKGVLPDNPISNALSKFVEGFGFDGKLVTSITELALMIVTFLLAWQLMKLLKEGKTSAIGGTLKQWFIRILIVFAFFPLASLVASSIGQTVKTVNENTQVTNAPVNKYLLDVRKWSASTNLAPTGLSSDRFPDAKSADGHIDTDFAPTSGQNRTSIIANINKESYRVMDGKTDPKKYGFDLLSRWSENSTFNVNTYIGDLRRSSSDTGETLEGVKNFKSKYKDKDPQKLEYFVWSGTQNITKDLTKTSHSNFRPYGNLGVNQDNGSFSTQSVALMLQTSFDTSGAKFYAYNIAPSGLQGNIKNASTVKTEWRQVTLPGDGSVGKFGSWLGLISESLSYVIVSVAVFVGLVTTNFFTAMLRFAKRTVHAIATGSVHSAMSTALIFLAGIVSLVIALGLPHIVIGLVDGIAGGVGSATSKWVAGGYVDIVSSVVKLFFAWYVSFGTKIKGYGMTPVRLIMSLPLEAAFRYDDRVDQLNRRGNTDIKATAKETSLSTGSVVKNGMRATGQHMGNSAKAAGAGAVGGTTGGIRNAYKGAKLGGKAGGPWGAAAGAAGGAAIGTAKGSKDAASKAFNNSKSSVMKNQGVDDATKDSMKNVRDKGKNVKDKTNAFVKHSKGLAADPKGTAMKAATLVGIGKLGKSAKELNQQRQNANGVAPEKPLSKNMVIPPSMLLKKSSKDSVQDKQTKDELKDLRLDTKPTGEQSQIAATNAKEMVGKDGEPMFTKEEHDTLSDSENQEQFVHNLRGTNNGEAYAMMTTSAKSSLQGTQFVSEDGNVNQQAIDSFNKELDVKQTAGTLSDDDMTEKRRLDSAFVMGAKEHYANAKPSNGPSGGSDNTPPNNGGSNGVVATGSNGQHKERPKRKGNNLKNNTNSQRPNGQSARTTTGGKPNNKQNKTYAAFKNNGGNAPKGGNAAKSAKQNFATQSASQTKKANTNQQQNKAMAQKQNQAQQKQAKTNQQKQSGAFNKQQRKQNQQNKQMLNKQQKSHNVNQKKQQKTYNNQQQKNNQQFKQNQQKQAKRQQDLSTRQNKRPQGKQANANTKSSRDKLD